MLISTAKLVVGTLAISLSVLCFVLGGAILRAFVYDTPNLLPVFAVPLRDLVPAATLALVLGSIAAIVGIRAMFAYCDGESVGTLRHACGATLLMFLFLYQCDRIDNRSHSTELQVHLAATTLVLGAVSLIAVMCRIEASSVSRPRLRRRLAE